MNGTSASTGERIACEQLRRVPSYHDRPRPFLRACTLLDRGNALRSRDDRFEESRGRSGSATITFFLDRCVTRSLFDRVIGYTVSGQEKKTLEMHSEAANNALRDSPRDSTLQILRCREDNGKKGGVATDRSGAEQKNKNASSDFHAAVSMCDSRPLITIPHNDSFLFSYFFFLLIFYTV